MPKTVFTEASIMQLPQRVRANFINSLSGFKSANLLGTRSISGVNNLALISSAFHVGANPPLLGMLMRPHTVVRDSLENIKETGVYTINHVHGSIAKQAHQCSARYEPEICEFDAVGLTPEFSSVVNAPFVGESKVKIALELETINKLEINQTELVIGRIVEVEVVRNALFEDGYLDIEQLDTLCVSGLDSYHQTDRLDRYAYAKPDHPLNSIWESDDDSKS